MKKILSIFVILITLSCSSDEATETFQDQVSTALGQSTEENPLEGSSLFFSDLSYGSAERNTYDIFLPKDGNSIGVVLFFHGGSFLFNDKSDVYNPPYASIIQNLLDQKVAVVNANYSFLTSSNSNGALTALTDGTLVLNHIRSLASSLQIDSDKIILGGASSGAGIALWNGLQAEYNTGVLGVVAFETQSGYNLYDWESLFTDLSIDSIVQNSIEFQLMFSLFYGGGVPTQEQLDALDFIDFIDSTDPELYLYNTAGNEFVASDGSIDLNVLYHSIRHSDALRGKALQEGLETSGAFQETPDDFVLRVLQ